MLRIHRLYLARLDDIGKCGFESIRNQIFLTRFRASSEAILIRSLTELNSNLKEPPPPQTLNKYLRENSNVSGRIFLTTTYNLT